MKLQQQGWVERFAVGLLTVGLGLVLFSIGAIVVLGTHATPVSGGYWYDDYALAGLYGGLVCVFAGLLIPGDIAHPTRSA